MLDYLNPSDKQKLLQMGYSIIRKLGEGSFSKVYLATYSSPRDKEKREFPRDQPVRLAVKLIDRNYLPENMIPYLDSEIYILGTISHPHIIHVHSILKRSNLFMIFMRHAEYGNLCSFLQTYGALKEKFARIWTRQLALALSYLHFLDIAHRGVKCENILVTLNNNVKLADLGFARFIEDSSSSHQALLCTTFCGTLPYAAPEIVQGKAPYDGKLADIWSLGIVLYVMLNKCLPFKSENLSDLWSDQVNKKYKFLPEVKASVTPETVTVVDLLLQPNPRERFSLENLLKCKWMAADPSLTDMTSQEKLAMKQAEKIRDIFLPHRKVIVDEDERLFTEEDAVYKQVMEKDPCDDTGEVETFNRGTFTYDLNPFVNLKEFGIY